MCSQIPHAKFPRSLPLPKRMRMERMEKMELTKKNLIKLPDLSGRGGLTRIDIYTFEVQHNNPRKSTMAGWKITIFDRRYIFIHGCCLMLFNYHVSFWASSPALKNDAWKSSYFPFGKETVQGRTVKFPGSISFSVVMMMMMMGPGICWGWESVMQSKVWN